MAIFNALFTRQCNMQSGKLSPQRKSRLLASDDIGGGRTILAARIVQRPASCAFCYRRGIIE